MNRPRVLLADDHRMVLDALEKLLESSCEVVSKAGDGRALLDQAQRLRPDVVVLDVSMPRMNGLTAGRHLRRMLPETKLIYLTVSEDPGMAAEALRIGAVGYLLKNSAGTELLEAIERVLAGKVYVTPLVTRDVIDSLSNPPGRPVDRLTPRQREIMQLVAEGHSMKRIGTMLNITPRTVAFHKYRVMKDLGLRTSAELIRFAIRNGLVQS